MGKVDLSSLGGQESVRRCRRRKVSTLKKHSKLRLMGAAAALAALTVVAAGGPASAGAKGSVGPSIKIKGNNDPHFVAPDAIFAGQDLQIVNKTDLDAIGPHSFSLVTKDALPKTRKQMRRCAHFHRVCKDILIAHNVDFEAGTFDADVENGSEGWDTPFDTVNDGDSWFTAAKDETTSRQVTAPGGTKLFFLCAIHPFMQGHIKVVSAP